MKDPARQSVLHGTALIFSGRMLNRFLGLGREILSAALFGSGRAMDSFNLAFTFVTSMRQSFAEQFLTPVIPTYFQRRNQDGEEAALRTLSFITTRLNLLTLVLSMALFTLAKPILRWIAPEFDASQIALTASMLRWFAAGGMAFILHRYYTGLHICFFRYEVVSFSPLLMNIVAISAMLLFAAKYSAISLAAGFSLGMLAYCLMQALFLPKRAAILTPRWGRGDPGVRNYAAMLLPLFISVAFEQIQLYVDRSLASGLSPGTLSAQGYSLRIIRMSSELWLGSFGTVVFPAFTVLAASGQREDFSRNFSLAMQAVILFLFFSGATILSQALPLVRILLERGAFSHQDSILTAHLLNFYAVAYISQAIWIIILRGFYAHGDTRTPVYATVFSMLVTILLDFLLIKPLGITGLALALAIGYSLNMVLAYVLFARYLMARHMLQTLHTLLLGGIAATILGLGIHIFWRHYGDQEWLKGFLPGLLALLAVSGAAGLLYFAALRLLRMPALEFVMDKIKQRRKKIKEDLP